MENAQTDYCYMPGFGKAPQRPPMGLYGEQLSSIMAFMFETSYAQNPTGFASNLDMVDTAYPDDCSGLKRRFKRSKT